MSLPGPLSLAQLLSLLAIGWALLLWIHLRKPRVLRREVPYLSSWEQLASGKTAQRVRRVAAVRSWALLRALLLASLLSLALHDPPSPWSSAGPATRLVILDAGAHMRARDETPTRFALAQRLAEQTVARAAPEDEVLVGQLAATFTPLSGFERDVRTLRDAVANARVSHEPTRFGAAVEYAMDVLRGRSRPQLSLISDGALAVDPSELSRLSAAGIRFEHVALGRSARNLAIRGFAVRALAWDAGRCEVWIELENTGSEPETIELTLLESGVPVDVRRLSLPAGRTERSFVLAASRREIAAKLTPLHGGVDAQPLDDVAYAVLSTWPPARVLLVGEGHPYLEPALGLDAGLQIERVRPGAYTSAHGYDLAIFDRVAPAAPPEAPSLWLAAPGDRRGAPLRVRGEIARPFFDAVDRDDPLLRFVALNDVNLRRAQRVELEPGDRAVAGTRAAPLIVRGTRAGLPFVALTFDVRESDLVLRSGWPILLSNAARVLLNRDLPFEEPLRLGRSQPVRVSGDLREVRLEAPDGSSRELAVLGGEVWVRPDQPGFYRLIAGTHQQLLAANPDPDASAEIQPRTIGPSPAERRSQPLVAALPAPRVLLIGGALLLLLFEAAFAARRSRA